jgi:hypothetical protein
LQRHFKKHFASNRKHGDEQEAVGDAQLPNEPTLDLDTQLRPSQIDKSWESREAREGMKFPALQSTSTNLTTTSARSGTESSRSKNPLGDRDHGLNVVYEPEGGHKVDIVFVHGLGGTARLTWSWKKDLEYFWPQVFLPHEPDICEARISTFGYNASVFKGRGKTTISILDFAKGLLFDLKYATDEKGQKIGVGPDPIIFVVHSMGGLIVKTVSSSHARVEYILRHS